MTETRIKMADEEEKIDEAEVQFDEVMLTCDATVLQEFCNGIGLPKELWENKKKGALTKLLRKKLEEDGEEDDVDAKLERWRKMIEGLKEVKREKEEKEKEGQVNGGKRAVKDETPNGVEGQDKDVTTITDKVMEKKDDQHQKKLSELLCSSSASVFRKDFRIIGQVGDQKDKLTFVSLMRQVEEGRKKGYPESEVVAGVLKAIGSRDLRSYLELIRDLDLKKLCEVIRVHYQEKSATELYQELIAMKQEKNEEASQFLIRALETREKILFTTEEAVDIKYEQETVHGLFLKTLESGLLEEVVNKIRSVLKKGVEDVELIREVSQAESMIKMREKKTASNTEKKVKYVASVVGEESETLKVMRQLKEELASLKTDMSGIKEQMSTSSTKQNFKRKRCKQCEEKTLNVATIATSVEVQTTLQGSVRKTGTGCFKRGTSNRRTSAPVSRR